MNCDKCSSPEATVHYSWMHSGLLHASDLCKSCSENDDNPSMGDGRNLIEFLNEARTSSSQDLRVACHESSEFCPNCKFPLENFKTNGFAGCPDCYRYLCPEELEIRLELINRSLEYKGKIPFSQKWKPGRSIADSSKINSKKAEDDISYSLYG